MAEEIVTAISEELRQSARKAAQGFNPTHNVFLNLTKWFQCLNLAELCTY